MVKKQYLISIILSIFFLVTMSIFVANRDIYSEGDSLIYIYNFENINYISNFRYEFLFDLVGYMVNIFTDNYVYYFFTINALLNIFLLISAYRVSNFYNLKIEAYLPIFFSILLLSSWYYTASFNGLRQGIALALLYIAILELFLFDRKYFFIIIYLSSCFFHYSNFLILPFNLTISFTNFDEII